MSSAQHIVQWYYFPSTLIFAICLNSDSISRLCPYDMTAENWSVSFHFTAIIITNFIENHNRYRQYPCHIYGLTDFSCSNNPLVSPWSSDSRGTESV